jgi:hypothetical protein
MKRISQLFSKVFGKNTSDGQPLDSMNPGCENTTNSTRISSSSKDTIYTKTNQMAKLYQWIKGDRMGEIVEWEGTIIQEDGMNFLIFNDGTRGNENLMGDFYMEIPHRNEPFIDMEMAAPQGNRLPKESNPPLTRVQNDFPTPGNFESAQQPISAISKLLNDSKKTKTTVKITIIADIPPTDLMKVLSESYDDGEKQVLDYLSANVDIGDVKNQIAKQIWEQVFTKKKQTRRNETI